MAIIRPNPPARDYTRSANTWLRDPTLSAKAKGMLSYIASHAPAHDLTFEQIVAEMRDDERSVRSGIKELEAGGHLRRWRRRKPDGTLGGYDWEVIDFPGASDRHQGDETQSGSDQGKGSVSADQNHTAKQQSGHDQGKRGVSAGQDQTAKQQPGSDLQKQGVSAGGNHTAKRRTKKTRVLEDQRKSSSSARVPEQRPAAEDRTPDDDDQEASPENPKTPAQRALATIGITDPAEQARITPLVEAHCKVKDPSRWWNTMRRNPVDLAARVAEVRSGTISAAPAADCDRWCKGTRTITAHYPDGPRQIPCPTCDRQPLHDEKCPNPTHGAFAWNCVTCRTQATQPKDPEPDIIDHAVTAYRKHFPTDVPVKLSTRITLQAVRLQKDGMPDEELVELAVRAAKAEITLSELLQRDGVDQGPAKNADRDRDRQPRSSERPTPYATHQQPTESEETCALP